jgi:hypothetical protein
MRIPKYEHFAKLNIWTVEGTWFWSVVDGENQAGAVGAATSKAEALHEAHAAIEHSAWAQWQ